jgi:hypothetical protein
VNARRQIRLRPQNGVCLALLSLLLLTIMGTAAAEADPGAVQLRVFDEEGNQVDRINAAGMYPTRMVEHTLFVDVDGDVPESPVAIELFNLRDYENGCNRPEIEAGDVTCGPGPDQGELSSQLEVGISVGAAAGGAAAPVCAELTQVGPVGLRLDQLEGQVVTLGTTAGLPACVVLALHFLDLPENNLAQTDTALFDLRIGLAQGIPPGGGETEVEAITVGPPGSQTGPPAEFITSTEVRAGVGGPSVGPRGLGALARTGLGVLLLAGIGLALVLAGLALTGARRKTSISTGRIS